MKAARRYIPVFADQEGLRVRSVRAEPVTEDNVNMYTEMFEQTCVYNDVGYASEARCMQARNARNTGRGDGTRRYKRASTTARWRKHEW